MSDLEARIKASIRDVPDFPKDGILFKDISTLLLQPALANEILDALVGQFQSADIEAIAGLRQSAAVEGETEAALRDFMRGALEREARSLASLDEVRHAPVPS